jgi:hypothetical protein
MSASIAAPELGEYAKKCVEVIRSFVPGREDEVEPAIRVLAAVYAKEDKDTVEKRFKEEYHVYKAAADTIATTELARAKYNELMKEGKIA